MIDEWEVILKTNQHTINTMCKLKLAGYRLYYLSNIASDTMEQIKQRDFFPLFDGGVASCDVHLLKPDPRIYTLLMQKYHLAYDESIFIDDNKQNAQGRLQPGITGILYKNYRSFDRALGVCGVELPDARGMRSLIRKMKRANRSRKPPRARRPRHNILPPNCARTRVQSACTRRSLLSAAGDLFPDAAQCVLFQPADLRWLIPISRATWTWVLPDRYRSEMIRRSAGQGPHGILEHDAADPAFLPAASGTRSIRRPTRPRRCRPARTG